MGAWSRSYIKRRDKEPDTTPVRYLQTPLAFIDVRAGTMGFAGVTTYRREGENESGKGKGNGKEVVSWHAPLSSDEIICSDKAAKMWEAIGAGRPPTTEDAGVVEREEDAGDGGCDVWYERPLPEAGGEGFVEERRRLPTTTATKGHCVAKRNGAQEMYVEVGPYWSYANGVTLEFVTGTKNVDGGLIIDYVSSSQQQQQQGDGAYAVGSLFTIPEKSSSGGHWEEITPFH